MGILIPDKVGKRYRLLQACRTFVLAHLFLCGPAISFSQAEPFNVASQPLPQALKSFSQQSGLQFMFLTDVVEGEVSAVVKGNYSLKNALHVMLKGTKLEFELTSRDTVTIKLRSVPTQIETEAEFALGRPEEILLDEIFVTARRRQERLIDVPVAMTVLSAAFLDTASAFSIDDVASMVPNLHVINLDTTSTTLFSLRGFGSDTTNSGLESGVAVYKDGVYIGRSAGFYTALKDIERVEVLRGPQGTLFGRNSILGAFNIISRKPDEEWGGNFEASMGSYNLQQVSGAVNIPFSDKLKGRFSGVFRNSDGYLYNRLTDGSINDRKSTGGKIFLHYEASETLDFSLIIDGQTDRSNGISVEISTDPQNRQSLTDRIVDVNEGNDNRDIWGVGFTARYVVSGYSLTSITGYRESRYNFMVDGDYTPLQTIVQGRGQGQHQFSEELRIDSPSTHRLSWTAGFFFFKQYHEDDSSIFYAQDALVFPFDTELIFRSGQKNNSYAFFASGNYAVTDQLTFTAGLRYTEESKTFNFFQTVTPSGFEASPFVTVAPFSGNRRWGNWSPTVVLNYAWGDAINTYAKFVRGFKSGGFNGSIGASSLKPDFDPEYISSYEVGLKAVWLNKKLYFNFAGFYLDYTDIQTNIVDVARGETFIFNEGETVGLGFEVDLSAQPFQGMDITASFSFLDVQKEEGPTLANRPRWTGSLSVQYGFPLTEALEAMIRTDLQFRSFFHSTRAHIFDNPASVLVNMRASVKISERNWEFFVWGRNLTNQTIISNTVPGDVIRSNLEAPRTWGVGGRVTF